MSEKVGDLAYIIVDCNNNERLAEFWSNVLGLEITKRSHPYIDLARSSDDAPVISFQQVEEPKTTKNRLHLDVKVPELGMAIEQITALGGRALQECVKGKWTWYVMADPEDNEFCIVTN